MSNIVYVNETRVAQTVYTPWSMPIHIPPGECVAGDWFKRYSGSPQKPLVAKEGYDRIPLVVIEDPAVGIISQLLEADPTLDEKVHAARKNKKGPALSPKS